MRPSLILSVTLAAVAQAAVVPQAAAASGLKWLGVSESVAEFGTALPGTWGVDFYFPSTTTIDTLISEGYNIFRIPFMLERMALGSITAQLDSGYLNNLTSVVTHITGKGKFAVLDAHNYGRYNGAVITDTAAFGTFWANLATQFKSNANVIFDINNEYHDMDQTLVLNLNQAAIAAIRGTGATSQYIFAEGNSWTGAWTWNTTNDNLKGLEDPNNKLVYEMHQYLNSDGSGSSGDCVSATVGVDRVVGATNWLRANGKLGVLGEFAGGPNSQCLSAVTGLLDHLQANSDVWQGALWWAAGPWWPASTYSSFEPPSGTAYQYYDSLLKKYVPA
ncbi:putative glycoside hydrolase family 5 protein [Diaporthe ampelina]|uniref:cellulase n=1 Tax=Diaporthe ampelina TaxID=1214573 RepID=A0A0G2FK76_9PEZI|nr:putative glycoside hydrolase family 5 protein [Diaporthe ampelina]